MESFYMTEAYSYPRKITDELLHLLWVFLQLLNCVCGYLVHSAKTQSLGALCSRFFSHCIESAVYAHARVFILKGTNTLKSNCQCCTVKIKRCLHFQMRVLSTAAHQFYWKVGWEWNTGKWFLKTSKMMGLVILVFRFLRHSSTLFSEVLDCIPDAIQLMPFFPTAISFWLCL